MDRFLKTFVLLAMVVLATATLRGEDGPTLEQARKKFETADALLNKTYKEACAGLDQAKLTELRNAEREWIAYRDGLIAADFKNDDGSLKKTADYWEAMTGYIEDRIKFLQAWTGKNVPAGIAGEYSDSYGATLELTEGKDGVEFDISAIRGRAHNEGEISGTIHPQGNKAHFKQELDPGDAGPPCELTFTFSEGHKVKIEQTNRDTMAGNNVWYGSDYYKIGKVAAPSPRPVPAASPDSAPTPAAEKPTVGQLRKTFETTDNLLTIAYKEAGAGLDQAKMAELRQKERDWIQYREAMAKSAPFFNTGAQTDAPKSTVDYWQEMNDITRSRVEFLRAYTGKNLPAGISGEYTDSYGGTLVLEEKKSCLAFSISTVRGMARNQGDIDGIAQRSGDKAVFKDHPAAADDRPPCEITFTFIEGHIVKIEEKNGDFYHGFNANFDGVYYKTGKGEKSSKPE